jgi:hypothetical protein
MLHTATELATVVVSVPITMGRHMDKGIQTVNINRQSLVKQTFL